MIVRNGIFDNNLPSGHLEYSSYSCTTDYPLWRPIFITLASAILPFFTTTACFGSELDFFRLTGIGGSLELGYSIEDIEVKRVDGTITNYRRPVSDQKLDIKTQSYVYHPNLLEMALGVGVEYKSEDIETGSTSNESRQKLYSFNGEFDFLKEKPYPLKLYYNQYNPTSSVGVADTVTHENKDYGLIFTLKDPIVSFPILLRANHSESIGKGGGTSINSEQDFQDIRITTKGLDNLIATISIDHSRKRSGSGSFNLPLQTTLNEKYGLDFTGTYKFGDNYRNTLFNKLSYDIDEFKGLSRIEDARFYLSLNMEHSPTFKSRYSYNIDKTINNDMGSDFTNEDMTIGILSELTENLSFTGDLDLSNEEAQGFDRNVYGFRSFLRYKTEITDNFAFNSSYLLKYQLSEQISELSYISLLGEAHRLENLQYVTLENDFVLSDSVVVSNQDRTQIYTPGIDYLLTVVGSETRVERLLSGNISDGESVLIDYRYETGGTFSYGLLNQAITTGITLYNNYRVSMGYSKQDESLVDGKPIRPLYTTETAYASADARHRLSQSMGLSWRLAVEREKSELRPFTRKEADINLTSALPVLNGFANLHSRYESIDNELSDEDVDLTLHGIGIHVRTGFRSRLSIKYSVEKDTGGTITRNVQRSEMDYMWRWRLLSFRLKGEYNLEEQGNASRKDSSVFLTLVRDF